MTVIAWDGVTLAADRRAVSGNMADVKTTKIERIRGHLVGSSGDTDICNALHRWFERGAIPEEFPDGQKNNERWGRLMVITPERAILTYEQEPFPMHIENTLYSIGSGAQFARAAMELGLSAAEAVEFTNRFIVDCGDGVDVLTFEDDDD